MTDDLESAAKAFRRAKADADERRRELHELIVVAQLAGVPQVDICRATGYTRESVRKIAKAAERRAN